MHDPLATLLNGMLHSLFVGCLVLTATGAFAVVVSVMVAMLNDARKAKQLTKGD